MKTAFASILILITIAIICSPIFIFWYGLIADIPCLWKIIMVCVGAILCRIVKPLSVLFDKDFKYI